jgi:hypothetical protein
MAIPSTAPAIEKPAAQVAAELAAAAAQAEAERIDEAVLFSGEPHQVARRDGTAEEVRVRLVSVRELPRFLTLQDDEAAVLELVCDRPAGWADGLAPAAHFELIGRARALNFPLALRWTRSQVAMQEHLATGILGRAVAKV